MLYRAFIQDFSKRYCNFCQIPLRPLIDFQNNAEKEEMLELLNEVPFVLPVLSQQDLAFFERLAKGLSNIETPYFYLTGADLPHFPFHFLDEVSLEEDSVTIGPDKDGGFYFLAGPKKCAQVFSRPIDSVDVFKSLVRNFQEGGFRVKVLKEWSDIDTAFDLVSCLNQFCADELPHTYDAMVSANLIGQQSLLKESSSLGQAFSQLSP